MVQTCRNSTIGLQQQPLEYCTVCTSFMCLESPQCENYWFRVSVVTLACQSIFLNEFAILASIMFFNVVFHSLRASRTIFPAYLTDRRTDHAATAWID
jgi:hypothetical protein